MTESKGTDIFKSSCKSVLYTRFLQFGVFFLHVLHRFFAFEFNKEVMIKKLFCRIYLSIHVLLTTHCQYLRCIFLFAFEDFDR